ncbi:lipolysis-stimulated lipoprotein receptor isoform X4 [Cuculus canorus]|uniref:lipolysis-stimulated lipoprotein receptor isoform X4 n=1 Tax=Cuculus canorus TaxID=55661 RepID=UPI0023AA7B61|nr:lipolysis-stimulated lipoprotein receptor isoform X4 [Cuculus canorus]
MAAMAAALLALLAPVTALQVTVTERRTVALLFQPVVLRCHYRTVSPEPPPIVTWKYKSFCPQSGGDNGVVRDEDEEVAPCPDGARTVRIVATKQGDVVTLGDFYRGRSVTIRGAAELSLGPAAWGDSGLYICTVTSINDLQGNNEAQAQLIVLGSLPEGTELLPGGGRGTPEVLSPHLLLFPAVSLLSPTLLLPRGPLPGRESGHSRSVRPPRPPPSSCSPSRAATALRSPFCATAMAASSPAPPRSPPRCCGIWRSS